MRGGAAVVARERVAAVTPPLISPLRGQLPPRGKPFAIGATIGRPHCRRLTVVHPKAAGRACPAPTGPSPFLARVRGRGHRNNRCTRLFFICAPCKGRTNKKAPSSGAENDGAKRNKQTAKKAQSKTPKRRRSLLLAGTAPERQNSRRARDWLWLVAANHAYTLPYSRCNVKRFPKNNSHYFCRI